MKLLCTASLTILYVAAFGQSNAALVKSFQSDYDKLSKAFAKNDIKVFDSYLAPNYVLYQPQGGTWDRARVIADFKKQMGNMKDAVWKRTVKSVKVAGNVATLVVDGKFKGNFKMQDGKMHTFELSSSTTDTWSIKPSHKLLTSHVGRLDPLIDGKKPQMGGGGGH